ncbi:hypothetical protein ACA910_003064 [Epithemia clementina (nom. ined.)]
MFPSSGTSKEVLRELLQQSLQDTLADVSFDAPRSNVGPYSPARTPAEQALLQPKFSVPPSFAGTSFPQLPSYFQDTLLGHSRPDMFQTRRDCANPVFAHAQADLLKQQIFENERTRRLEESYLAILRDSHSSVSKAVDLSTRPFALEGLLATGGSTSQQQVSLTSIPVSQGTLVEYNEKLPRKPAPSALEALGCSLRKKNDPYIDVSALQDPDPKDTSVRRTRGGVSTPFPEKLHQMLMDVEKEGNSNIVSFFSHGRAFAVHDMGRFVSDIMPRYFKQSKWNSFARQLNLYGFIRISHGPDAGGYYHELFLKGRPNLCFHMRRVGVPQGEDRRKIKTKHEAPDPDFYSMKPVTASNSAAAP